MKHVIVASLTHAEALDRPSLWDEIDVVLADAADERNRADHFPGVAVVDEVRRHDRGGQTFVVITGHFFDDAVRTRMREAKADFYYHRTVVCDARSLSDAVFRPDAQRRVPGPVDPETLFSGREQILLSGDRRVVLPADPGPAAPSQDLGPVALQLGAVTVLSQIAGTYGRGPLAGAWDAYREVEAVLPRAVAEKFERWLAEVSTRLRRICTEPPDPLALAPDGVPSDGSGHGPGRRTSDAAGVI